MMSFTLLQQNESFMKYETLKTALSNFFDEVNQLISTGTQVPRIFSRWGYEVPSRDPGVELSYS